jgi:predicted kinase
MLTRCLIVVTGLPGTGKTEMARRIARELEWPLISKDGIKETLFDSLGWSDRARSRELGRATYALIEYLQDVIMPSGVSFILESNFRAELAGKHLARRIAEHRYKVVQVLCKAEGSALVERFRVRAASGERHKGHVDLDNMDELEPQLMEGRIDPLPLPGLLLEVDTTDFSMVDYDSILKTIRNAITTEEASQLGRLSKPGQR